MNMIQGIMNIQLALQDWAGQSGSDIVSALCGFITVLSGTIMLHVTREQEPVTLPGMDKTKVYWKL